MLRYRVKSIPPKYMFAGWKREEAVVILRVDDAQTRARYEVEGDPDFADKIKRALSQSAGLRGLNLKEVTTAPDLHSAMFDAMMRPYEPELIEGAELFDKADR